MSNDLLAPPPLTNGRHSKEGTSYSTPETVVDQEHARAPSGSTGFSTIVSDAVEVTPPEDYTKPVPHTRPTFSKTTIPAVIPPPQERKGRTLVLCFDGTGDQFDLDNSNVVQLVSLLQKNEKSQQMVYYQVRVESERDGVTTDVQWWSRRELEPTQARTRSPNPGFPAS